MTASAIMRRIHLFCIAKQSCHVAVSQSARVAPCYNVLNVSAESRCSPAAGGRTSYRHRHHLMTNTTYRLRDILSSPMPARHGRMVILLMHNRNTLVPDCERLSPEKLTIMVTMFPKTGMS